MLHCCRYLRLCNSLVLSPTSSICVLLSWVGFWRRFGNMVSIRSHHPSKGRMRPALGHTRLKKKSGDINLVAGCNFRSKEGMYQKLKIKHRRIYSFLNFVIKSPQPLRRQGKTMKGGSFLLHSETKDVELLPWWKLFYSYNSWEIQSHAFCNIYPDGWVVTRPNQKLVN